MVEASIIARLLRWRLLTLDASVLLLPADSPGETRFATPQRHTWTRRSATRRRLSDAITYIDQAEKELARARHTNGTAAPERTMRRGSATSRS